MNLPCSPRRQSFLELSQTTAKQINRPSSYEQVAPFVQLEINPLYEEAGQRSVDDIRKSMTGKPPGEYDSLNRRSSGQRVNEYRDVNPNDYDAPEQPPVNVNAIMADDYSHINAYLRHRAAQPDSQDYSSLQRDNYSHIASTAEPVRYFLRRLGVVDARCRSTRARRR